MNKATTFHEPAPAAHSTRCEASIPRASRRAGQHSTFKGLAKEPKLAS